MALKTEEITEGYYWAIRYDEPEIVIVTREYSSNLEVYKVGFEVPYDVEDFDFLVRIEKPEGI